VLLSEQRDTAAARRFFNRALRYGPAPVEVTTDKAGPYLRVLDELVPTARHVTEQFANNRVEADHARLKARLRPMRGLTRFRSAAVIAGGHAFIQNLRRGHYELATDASPPLRLAAAFTELAQAPVTSASSRPDACHLRPDATDPSTMGNLPSDIRHTRGLQQVKAPPHSREGSPADGSSGGEVTRYTPGIAPLGLPTTGNTNTDPQECP
jgi:transposase, IS6 family